jgi:D-methionine transport system substrate-binding protein
VVPAALENDERVKELAKLLEGPEVADFIDRTYPGSVLPVNPGSK